MSESIFSSLGRLWVAIALALAGLSFPVHAAVVTDAVGDFNTPFYTGRLRADLDVVSFGATFDGTRFHLSATMAGPIDTSPAAGLLYVIGINTGSATAPGPFASVGAPNVIFNSVVTLTGTGTLGGVAGGSSGATESISGNSFRIDIPLAAIVSTGFTALQYGFNLWPRDALAAAGNGQISDFAPNNGTITATAVPEPPVLLLMAIGMVGLGMGRRR